MKTTFIFSVDSKMAESVNFNQINDVNDVFEVLDSDDEIDTAPSNVFKTRQQKMGTTHGDVSDNETKSNESNPSEIQNGHENENNDGDIDRDGIGKTPKQECNNDLNGKGSGK